MVKVSSDDLHQFYKDWLSWAENGGVDNDIFGSAWGLCANLDDYAVTNSLYRRQISMEMEKQFVDAGLDPNYPFGEFAYGDAEYHCTMHKDEKRLNWVRTRIKEYNDAN